MEEIKRSISKINAALSEEMDTQILLSQSVLYNMYSGEHDELKKKLDALVTRMRGSKVVFEERLKVCF